MEITEVRVKLVQKSKERLRAFCSITFDESFVIRDLKVIGSGNDDGVFVAMPSRKLCDRCPRCRAKNHLRARFCNECGNRLGDHRVSKDSHGRAKIHADVAHPINTECREMIQGAILKAFAEELERSKSPDYKAPRFDDSDEAMLDEIDTPEPRDDAQAPAEPVVGSPSDLLEEIDEDCKASESAFSDYDSLIAELKQEAAGRYERKRDWRGTPVAKTRPPEEPVPVNQSQASAGADHPERRSGQDRRDRRERPPVDERPPEPAAKPSPVPAQPPVAVSTPPPALVQQRPAPAKNDDAFGAGVL